MRKKEPPSPAMAAHAGPPLSLSLSPGSLAEALTQKRDALEREVAAFRARKEEEFQAYERRLSSASAVDLENLKLKRKDTITEKSEGNGAADNDDDARGSRRELLPSSGVKQQPSPITPQHDKERELQGLFLPHFIPLLDDPPAKKKRAGSPVSRPHTAGAEIPAQRAGVHSSDPSAFSPRTSPSPTLITGPYFADVPTSTAIPINALTPKNPINPSFTFERPTPGATPSSVPLSPSAIPAHLRPSSRSASENNNNVNSTDSSPLLAPTPDRPAMGTRTSSSQSDGSSVISLRSSMRKSSSLTRAGDAKSYKKKSVRISIGDSIMAPSESPIQTRSAFKPPTTPGPMSTSTFSGLELASSMDDLSFVDDRGRVDARDEKAGKARIDDEGGARRRRKKRVGTPTALATNGSSKSKSRSKSRADEPLDYFPPQPLRSPRLPVSNPNGRYIGTELIEPTTPTTPPAYKADVMDDFEDDDPLFGGGGVSPARARREARNRIGDDEEDLFREDEDGRENEDMEVMNGHDLVEDDEDEAADALPSPSPHASSMPIGIKGPSAWRIGMGSSLGRG